ncbi:MAG: hypothetical protein ACYTDU_20175 [Planctomycetota bacterium]|jgi:hypothetical protein
MTARILLCAGLVFVIFLFVPFLAYGTYSALTGLEPPDDVEPAVFMASVFLEKLGHTIAFVGIFCLARGSLRGRWLWYAAAWWSMFVIAEAALAIRSEYSWPEAIAGMISETIYFPLAALVARRFLGPAT